MNYAWTWVCGPSPETPTHFNPKKTGLFWRLERLGGGGGAMMAPLEISAVDCAIAAKICTMVVCDVIYKIVYLDFPKYFYFILY